jgi:hypothetical protein
MKEDERSKNARLTIKNAVAKAKKCEREGQRWYIHNIS